MSVRTYNLTLQLPYARGPTTTDATSPPDGRQTPSQEAALWARADAHLDSVDTLRAPRPNSIPLLFVDLYHSAILE